MEGGISGDSLTDISLLCMSLSQTYVMSSEILPHSFSKFSSLQHRAHFDRVFIEKSPTFEELTVQDLSG